MDGIPVAALEVSSLVSIVFRNDKYRRRRDGGETPFDQMDICEPEPCRPNPYGLIIGRVF